MNKSNAEEIIAILWFILSLMLLDRDYIILGKTAFGLGLFAMLCSIVMAIRKTEVKQAPKG